MRSYSLGTLVRDIILKLNDERSRDPLTYLLNRRGFYDAAKINLIDLPEKQYFLLMCDVDHFKKINDTHGHLVGDQILQSVGRLVSQHVGEKGLVGRFVVKSLLFYYKLKISIMPIKLLSVCELLLRLSNF